jgi:hypothetical protein
MSRARILTALTFHSIVMIFLGGCQSAAPTPALASIPISKIQFRFDGPGGSATHDFVNANNACKNETGYTTSGGMPPTQIIPTCDVVMQCLSSKGFYSTPDGKFDPEELGIGISCLAN